MKSRLNITNKIQINRIIHSHAIPINLTEKTNGVH